MAGRQGSDVTNIVEDLQKAAAGSSTISPIGPIIAAILAAVAAVYTIIGQITEKEKEQTGPQVKERASDSVLSIETIRPGLTTKAPKHRSCNQDHENLRTLRKLKAERIKYFIPFRFAF